MMKSGVVFLFSLTIKAKNDTTPVIMTAFREAPRLREVRLSGASLRWISLPWTQLTQLEFWDESTSRCFQVLKETPNLEVLDVHLPRRNMERLPSLQFPLTLPHLHTLKFASDLYGELLDHLVPPALKTIHLPVLLGMGTTAFTDLGVRSAWSLQSIHLSDMTVNDCTACLRSLSSVTHVHVGVKTSNFTSYDMDELIALFDKDKKILPALETLVIRDCGTEVPAWRLRKMLESRTTRARDGEVKLKTFRLDFGRHAPVALKEFVEGLWLELLPVIDAGLEVSIDFPSV
ncbi:F-box domain-containing protein [Mycena sanguinolenta]|uniref:F-box domain-containing protein n=1 Tax=Mycena sanguinolenta TaxID=230812 RepID=A0A8H6Z1F4_9AGAR|nr:F-box domain-containing protein [Mycena sanguinolenta]